MAKSEFKETAIDGDATIKEAEAKAKASEKTIDRFDADELELKKLLDDQKLEAEESKETIALQLEEAYKRLRAIEEHWVHDLFIEKRYKKFHDKMILTLLGTEAE